MYVYVYMHMYIFVYTCKYIYRYAHLQRERAREREREGERERERETQGESCHMCMSLVTYESVMSHMSSCGLGAHGNRDADVMGQPSCAIVSSTSQQ